MLVEKMDVNIQESDFFLPHFDIESELSPEQPTVGMMQQVVAAIPKILQVAGLEKRRQIFSVVSIVLAFGGVLQEMSKNEQTSLVDTVTDMILEDPSKLEDIESFMHRTQVYQAIEV